MPEITGHGIRIVTDADGNIVSETVLLTQDGFVVLEKTERGYKYCQAKGDLT